MYLKAQQSFGLSYRNCPSSLGEGVILNDRMQRVHCVLTDYAHF
jgi:ribosomal protein S27AE